MKGIKIALYAAYIMMCNMSIN